MNNGARPAEQILVGKGRQAALYLHLAGVAGQLDRRVAAGRQWDVAEQFVDAGGADGGQHGPPVILGKRQITH